MLLNTWGLVPALRKVGLDVREVSGWLTRSHGQLPAKPTVVWHHDASPKGDSPGVINWMVSNWNRASAQVWIDRRGTIYLVGNGVAWHAGVIHAKYSAWGSWNSIGIETDHTTGEDWPEAQLRSLTLFTAVVFNLCRYTNADALNFHKIIASPTGRKIDPDGLELEYHRRFVSNTMKELLAPPIVLKDPEEGEMNNCYLASVGGQIVLVNYGERTWYPFDNTDAVRILKDTLKVPAVGEIKPHVLSGFSRIPDGGGFSIGNQVMT